MFFGCPYGWLSVLYGSFSYQCTQGGSQFLASISGFGDSVILRSIHYESAWILKQCAYVFEHSALLLTNAGQIYLGALSEVLYFQFKGNCNKIIIPV